MHRRTVSRVCLTRALSYAFQPPVVSELRWDARSAICKERLESPQLEMPSLRRGQLSESWINIPCHCDRLHRFQLRPHNLHAGALHTGDARCIFEAAHCQRRSVDAAAKRSPAGPSSERPQEVGLRVRERQRSSDRLCHRY